MFKCEYCGKGFKKYQSLSAHKSHCELNPNKIRTHEKNSEASKKAAETYKANHPEQFVKQEYTCQCERCGGDYTIYVTPSQFSKGQYSKYCSRSCANTRVISEETKKKISNSIKISDKAEEARKGQLKVYHCKQCGKSFTMDDERDVTGRKYCSQECKDKWLRENLYSKSGGYRKGSGRGKKGWYKGIYCDSSWELAFVIYHLDHNLSIERSFQKRKYIFKGEEHTYWPDFETNEGTIEIKGYSTSQWQAKQEQNPDIKVLYKKDIKPYLDYVITKYGTDFIKMYDGSNPRKDINNKKYLWMHNTIENIYIHREDFEEYQIRGYVHGRLNSLYK